MSTTLTVLHVLMSSHYDAMGDRLLMTSSTPSSSLMASLDPILVDFWSAFPCPPPWNEGLLFSVNWTSCVSHTVGERIKWFLADRCNIPHNKTHYLPDGPGGAGAGDGFGGYGEEDGGEVCDLSCQVLAGLFCILFVVAVVGVGVFVFLRRRSKRKDQRGTSQTGGSGGDRGRALYAGIHYASASVINREGERPLPPCPTDAGGLPRQLHSYVYNPRENDHPSHPSPPDHGFHLHLCPMNRRAAYRAMEPGVVVGVGNSGSRDSTLCGGGGGIGGDDGSPYYPPHVYDYISDTDSVRWRGGGGGSVRGGGGEGEHEYTYCTCDCSDGSSVAAEYGNGSGSTPRQSEGYHSDHDTLRHPHEVSKPNPRYPGKGSGGGGGGGGGGVPTALPGGVVVSKPLPGGSGGLNINNNNNDLVLRLRDGGINSGSDGSSRGGGGESGSGGVLGDFAAVPRANNIRMPVDSGGSSNGRWPPSFVSGVPLDSGRTPQPHLLPAVSSSSSRHPQQTFPPVVDNRTLPMDGRNHSGMPVDGSRSHSGMPTDRNHSGLPAVMVPSKRNHPSVSLPTAAAAAANNGRIHPFGAIPAADHPHLHHQSRNRSGGGGGGGGGDRINDAFQEGLPSENANSSRARSDQLLVDTSTGSARQPPPQNGGSRELPFVNALPHGGGVGMHAQLVPEDGLTSPDGHEYEYPENPLDQAGHRANALALHPGYFIDYFDGGTSAV